MPLFLKEKARMVRPINCTSGKVAACCGWHVTLNGVPTIAVSSAGGDPNTGIGSSEMMIVILAPCEKVSSISVTEYAQIYVPAVVGNPKTWRESSVNPSPGECLSVNMLSGGLRLRLPAEFLRNHPLLFHSALQGNQKYRKVQTSQGCPYSQREHSAITVTIIVCDGNSDFMRSGCVWRTRQIYTRNCHP